LKYYLLVFVFIIFSCKKKSPVGPKVIIAPVQSKGCRVSTDFRSDGQLYEFLFNKEILTNIKGYNDFDTFVHDGTVFTKAYHTNNKNAEILFNWNSKLLNKITFQGTDSQGKKFSYATNISHDGAGRISNLTIEWPTFPEKVNTRFFYDQNSNVTKIEAFLENEWKVILENTVFDTKKSAYKNQELGQIFSYYMVYTILGGGFNFTHYLNNNNVLAAVVTKGETRINYNYSYVYNANQYPTEVEYSRVINNKTETYKQKFTYKCEL
jgi:hypothetical protein